MGESSRIRVEDYNFGDYKAHGDGGSRSASVRRWGALIGGALAIYGITRKSRLGMALVAGGSAIAVLTSAQRPRRRSASAWTSLLINCSPQEAFQFWRGFENLPRFMNHLQTVAKLDDRRSRWVAVGPAGQPIRWDAEITSERENEHIAWHSLPGSDLEVDGMVQFQPAPANRGTLVSARLAFRSALPSKTLSKFLQRWTNFAIRQDMRRLENLMEAGEIPTIEGQTHGPRDVVTAALRMADPTRPFAPRSSLRDVFAAKRSVA